VQRDHQRREMLRPILVYYFNQLYFFLRTEESDVVVMFCLPFDSRGWIDLQLLIV